MRSHRIQHPMQRRLTGDFNRDALTCGTVEVAAPALGEVSVGIETVSLKTADHFGKLVLTVPRP